VSDIIYNEPEIRKMIALLRETAAKYKEVQGACTSLGKQVEGGALIGAAGTNLVEAINQPLNNSLNRIITKLQERANYVERELEQHLRTVEQNRGLFG